MSDRDIIVERIRKKEAEIQGFEERLKVARIYVQALQDILNVLARDSDTPQSDSALRPGSSVTLARDVILKAGQPVHINELLDALGKGITREGRASLTSSLAAYVRRGDIFTRPAPNTFGLIELGHTQQQILPPDEPPPSFGKPAEPLRRDDEIPL